MDRLKELLAEIAALFAGESPMDEVEALAVDEAMRAEVDALPDDEKKALEGAEETDAQKSAIDKLMMKAAKTRQEHKVKKQQSLANRYQTVKGQMQNAPATSPTDKLGGVTKSSTARVSNVSDLRYAHLSAGDMALGLQVLAAPAKAMNMRIDPRSLVSEDYLRAMTHKAYTHADSRELTTEQQQAFKSVLPYKADELNASNIPTQGEEWVGDYWATTIWQRKTYATIYERLVAKGMMIEQVPQGADSAKFPLEGNDPIVYSAPEANHTDVTARPEVTAAISPFTTGQVIATPKELKAATAYTDIFDEDSIIRLGAQVNRQLTRALMETRDKVLVNGDTATASGANVNATDTVPPGLGTIYAPYYLNSNGVRKLCLVTAPTKSRDGGALALADFLATIALLDGELQEYASEMAFIVDPGTMIAALAIPEIATDDVRRTNATITSGLLTDIYGIDVLRSGFVPKTNAAGEVEVLTPGNNTKGSILLVYAPYWGFAYKRDIKIETARDIMSGSTVYVGSMRMAVVPRGSNAAAMSYNITI